jgi:hypothetical protein
MASAISDQSESRYAHMIKRITSDQIGSDEPIWSENALDFHDCFGSTMGTWRCRMLPRAAAKV